jgi:hypothetical protein
MTLEAESFYHNQHDPDKGFTHVRVRSGYVPQAQEINELQSIQDTQREKLGNLLFTSGSIQRGGGYNKTGSEMALEETSIWFQGRVLTAPAKTIGMNDAGTETVGILVSEILVTGAGINADPALLEPDIDALNYGLEGANRTKITAEWVRNNANAVPVYTFVEGVQQVAVPSSQIDPVNAAMARRTYAESGNYVVTGFEVEVREANTDALVFSYKVGNQGDNKRNGSLAYVKGNEIAKLVPDYVTVDKALTKLAAFEQFTYAPSDPDDPGSATVFALPDGKQPPELNTLTTTVRAIFDVTIPVSGHNANGTDPLTLGSGHTLTDILRVFKDADINEVADPTTVYLKATSQAGPGAWYRSGDSIKWDASSAGISAWLNAPTAYTEGQVVSYLGNTWQAKQASSGENPEAGVYWQQVSISEPSNGDSYYAYALISRPLSASEYVIENNNGVWQLNVSSLLIKPYAKNKINDETTSSLVTINYNFYLPRVDVIYVDGDGVVSAQQGTPSKAPIAPSVPGDVLALAQVTVGGGLAPKTTIKPYTTKRKTMLEIQDMDQRLRRLELNVALKDLDDQGISKARDVMATLRGILTEGFAYTIEDIQEDSDEDSRLKFRLDLATTGCLDVSRRQLTLPLLEAAPVTVVPTGSNSGGTFALTLDEAGYFYPETYLDQQKRTNTLRVNQFDSYIAPPTVEIHPLVGNPENNGAVIKTYDPTSAAAVAQLYKANWKDYTQGLAESQRSFVNKGKLNDFMKREWVWVYGNGYPANTLIEIRVDGRAPKLRATNPVHATFPFNGGSVPTTAIVQASGASATEATVDGVTSVYPETCLVRTTSLGKFGCAILIPEGLPTGAVAISAVAQDAAQKGSQAVYTVQGTLSIEDNGAAAMYQLTALTDFAFNQVPPRITNMVIKVGGTTVEPVNGIYNYTASSNITVEVYWDKGSANRAGLPREVVLLVKGSGKSSKLTKVSGDAGFDLNGGFATFSGDVLNSCATGLEFAAFASNVRGTGEPFGRTIRYQDQVPTHFTVSVDKLLQPTNAGGNVFEFGYTAGTNVSSVVAKYTLPDGTQVTLTPIA